MRMNASFVYMPASRNDGGEYVCCRGEEEEVVVVGVVERGEGGERVGRGWASAAIPKMALETRQLWLRLRLRFNGIFYFILFLERFL